MDTQELFLKLIEEEQLEYPIFIALIRVDKIKGLRDRDRLQPEADNHPHTDG